MNRFFSQPNNILFAITNLVKDGDISADIIIRIIDEAKIPQLLTSFLYLCNWVLCNSEDIILHENMEKLNNIQNILGLILLHIPPVMFYNPKLDVNWGEFQFNWILQGFFKKINDRIIKLRSYIKPINVLKESFVISREVFEDDTVGHSNELELDPALYVCIVQYFKDIILNREPIDKIRMMSNKRNFKEALTEALIQLMSLIHNQRSNYTDNDIVLSNTIFLYLHSFAQRNELYASQICSYIISRPYMTHSLAIGIINHISPYLYFYDILTPSSSNFFHIKEPQEYDPNKFTHGKFFENMHLIIDRYKLNSPLVTSFNDRPNSRDLDGVLIYLHLSEHPITEKLKYLCIVAYNNKLSPSFIALISNSLLIHVPIVVKNHLTQFMEKKFFNGNFLHFVKSVFSFLSYTCLDKLISIFFDIDEKDEDKILCLLKAIHHFFLNILVSVIEQDVIMRFVMHAAKYEKCRSEACALLGNLTVSNGFRYSMKFLEDEMEVDDLIICFELIDGICRTYEYEDFDMQVKLFKIRDKLAKKFDALEIKDELYFIKSFAEIENFHELINKKLSNMKKLTNPIPIYEVEAILEGTNYSFLSLKVATLSIHCKREDYAEFLVDKFVDILLCENFTEDYGTLELTKPYLVFIASKMLLFRLLTFNFHNLTLKLLGAMERRFKTASLTLNYIYRLLTNMRDHLTPEIKIKLYDIITGFKYAAEYFPKDINKIMDIGKRLDELYKTPNLSTDFVFEFPNLYITSKFYTILAYLISDKSNAEIAYTFTSRINKININYVNNNKIFLILTRVIAKLNFQTTLLFFHELMKLHPTKLVCSIGRLFVLESRLNTFKYICENGVELVQNDVYKLDFYAKSTAPSYLRFIGSKEIAANYLCSLLRSIRSNFPISLQETIVDIVSLIYIKLDLATYRARIIESSTQLEIQQRRLLASILDV